VRAELTIAYFVYIFQDGRSVWDRAGLPVAIYRLIASGTFGPEEIKAMAAAYEGALIDLQLVDRNDPCDTGQMPCLYCAASTLYLPRTIGLHNR
jgi:hypothetical protein